MNSTTIKCENCGTICNAKDGYCKNCWKKLGGETEQADFIIDGIGQTEWEDYIDKNAKRYVDVYKNNNGKKWFLHINWAAFFLGLNWVLYRKMYKVAVIGFIVTSLITVALSVLFLLPHTEEMKILNQDIAPYREYIKGGGQTIMLDADGRPYSPEIVQKGAMAERKNAEIEAKAKLKTLIIVPFTCIFWGLFGDAIYKKHIIKNIKNKNGGASIGAVICGRMLLSLVEWLLTGALVSLLVMLLLL